MNSFFKKILYEYVDKVPTTIKGGYFTTGENDIGF